MNPTLWQACEQNASPASRDIVRVCFKRHRSRLFQETSLASVSRDIARVYFKRLRSRCPRDAERHAATDGNEADTSIFLLWPHCSGVHKATMREPTGNYKPTPFREVVPAALSPVLPTDRKHTVRYHIETCGQPCLGSRIDRLI